MHKERYCFSLQSEWTLLHLAESCKAREAFVLVFDWFLLKSWNSCLLLPTHVVDYPCECVFSGLVVNFIFISLMYLWNAKESIWIFCVTNNSQIWMFAGFGSLGLMTSVLVCIRFLLQYFSAALLSLFFVIGCYKLCLQQKFAVIFRRQDIRSWGSSWNCNSAFSVSSKGTRNQYEQYCFNICMDTRTGT